MKVICAGMPKTGTKQEKMRGQRGRLPVQPLGYVMSTKVIYKINQQSSASSWIYCVWLEEQILDFLDH